MVQCSSIYIGLLALLAIGAAGEDYEYVVLFMENLVEEIVIQQDVELYVASRSTSEVSVTIDNPGGSILSNSISFTLAPNTITMYSIPQSARQVNEYANKAIRVIGSGDIIVYVLNRNLYSTDGLTVFRVDQVGTEYYAMSYTAEYNTQIGLVAVEDGVTEVEITVPAVTAVEWSGTQYNAGQVFTVTLDAKYRTARVKSLVGDLTGAKIVATQKISAFSGNVRTKVDGNSRDHLVEQLPPIVQWGFNYYTVRTPARTSDRPDIVRIVAHEDDTNVEVRGGVNIQFVINAGEYRELSTLDSLWINSNDKSVMVGVISSSQSQDPVHMANDKGDPSLIVMPAVGQYSNNYIFSTPRYIPPSSSSSTQYDIHVLVIVRTDELTGIRLDGVGLSNSVVWSRIANSEYSSAQIPVDNDRAYSLLHIDPDVVFMALLYGSADRESFYFPIDVGMANINTVVPVNVQGNKGERGSTGRAGVAGATGPKGFTGGKGNIGATGIRGEDGEKGAAGVAGFPSANGATGSRGAPGLAGVAGSTGAFGPAGLGGSIGATGATGATGPRGNTGNAGSKGNPGTAGEKGMKGVRGTSGEVGEKGEKGSAGGVGVTGPAGYPGEKGYVAGSDCNGVCSVESSSAIATCRSTFGTVNHLCSCPSGYHVAETNPNLCVDVNECAMELCSHGCTNVVGGYTCSCPSDGYELVGNTCVDKDECADSPCGADVCINGIGSYICLPSSTPAAQISFSGLQSLYQPSFFIAVFCILLIITLLVIIVSICLLARLKKRQRMQQSAKQLIAGKGRPYTPSVILPAGYY